MKEVEKPMWCFSARLTYKAVIMAGTPVPGFNEQVQHLRVTELLNLGGYGKEI